MTQQSFLKELVRKGESQTVEFKKSLSLQREGLEALCAMVNSDLARGTVIFGVEKDGTVCGIEEGNLDTAQRSLSQTIRNKFDPPLIVQMKVEELNDEQVLVISAERSRDVPYHEYDGRAWIREGTEKRRLSLAERQQLMKKKNRDNHPGPWRCDRCGSWVGVLHSFEISNEGMKKTYKCDCGGEFWPAS
ncbi:MAG: ATP-binding protein [Dehalococcoidia bacterium]|nr:ATP-binding protein [Dehalococcoidia bacterium]